MIGRAVCRGAATIVNAIATGKGAAFGISLETRAEVQPGAARPDVEYVGDPEGRRLVTGCIHAVASLVDPRAGARSVNVSSEVPPSRGLKSSSAVSNAVVLAASRAFQADMDDMQVVNMAIDESIKAGVTITGAFDDACACYFGGVVLTDNAERRILMRARLDDGLTVLAHIPAKQIKKHAVRGLDFSGIRPQVEEAFALASSGNFVRALEMNSRAYARVLDLSEDVAEDARRLGAVAAGISGTGPATVILCRRGDEDRISRGLATQEGRLLRAELNTECSRGL